MVPALILMGRHRGAAPYNGLTPDEIEIMEGKQVRY
jgi:hypothetical protein